MSLFGKIFGQKENRPASSPPPVPAADPAKDPNMIRVHDAYGRELFITRNQWRDSVLLGNIEKAWNNPDELYHLIISALTDGFRSDVVKAAEQLYKIDLNPVRGACIWGIVLNEEGRLDEAEAIFQRHMAKHGEDGVILTNLAKVYSKRGDDPKAEALLWHALELDPNQANGMGWYEVIHRERGGEDAGLKALRRVAQIPGSWRAQLWLGRAALHNRDLAAALDHYQLALSRVNPIPPDALMQISGDLGQSGHLIELLEITGPRFDPQLHGLQVGNNLIKACLDLGQMDAAQTVIDQLYALGRPDWKEALNFWDTAIAKARLTASSPVSQEELKVAMLLMDGPVWLKPTSPAAELFPAKAVESVRIAFLGSSAEIPSNSQRIEHQLSDTRGRLSRSIPLFLTEQIQFGTEACAQTLVPWIANNTGGFVVSGGPWSDDRAAAYAREGGVKNNYVVCSHLKTGTEPWLAQVRVIRTIDGACIGTAEAPLLSEQPTEGLRELTQKVLDLLAREAEVTRQPFPEAYTIPNGNDFPYYLLRLEQLLAVRCAAMTVSKGGESFLNGQREILDGNLHQCLAYPKSLSVRVLLAQTFWTMKLAQPAVLPEFRERIEMLQREHPLAEPAQSVAQRILDEAFTETPPK
jgi:tetratricopeptide (TPR) repeat protein